MQQPDEQTDASGSQVTQFSCILLPFLLKTSTSGRSNSQTINQLHLPLLAKRDQLAPPFATFPPPNMAQSFYMPCARLRDLFAHLAAPPSTASYLDAPLTAFQPPQLSLQPLLNLLTVVPFFFPSQVLTSLPP